jgi:hypothetical protein
MTLAYVAKAEAMRLEQDAPKAPSAPHSTIFRRAASSHLTYSVLSAMGAFASLAWGFGGWLFG